MMSWYSGSHGKGGHRHWWPRNWWYHEHEWEWSTSWKGSAKGKSGKQYDGKGWNAWSNKLDLGGYSDDTLTVQDSLGWGVSGVCYRGIYETDGSKILVAIKPANNRCEVEVLNRILSAKPRLQCVVPVFLVEQPTSVVDVHVMALGSLGSLGCMLQRIGGIGKNTFLAVIARIAEGLAALHSENIIHCDLKPDNVVLNEERSGDVSVWLIDFGDARLLDKPDTWFTQGWGAPEVHCVPDTRSGQFSSFTDSWCLAQCAACIWSSGKQNVDNPAWLYDDMPLYVELQQCLTADPCARLDASTIARVAHDALKDLGTDAKSELARLVSHT